MTAKVFSHSGDVGDLFAALPTVKALGGGRLHLFPAECTGRRMSRERAESVAALLRLQPYLSSVDWGPEPEGTNLDEWRNHYKGHLNLADMVADAFGVPHSPRNEPWLSVAGPKKVARVVVHRSARYHNYEFPWLRVWEKYRGDMVFVGSPDEHFAFQQYAGPVSYCHTSDYLELARVIAGADLFIGNQSSPFWVAEGLKAPTVLEVCLYCSNCHFDRVGVLYGRDREVELPDLPHLVPQARSFDVRPYLHPEDPWVRAEGAAVAAEIYDGKNQIAALLRPRRILEIGVRAGYSAAAFLAAVPDAAYVGLDADNGAWGGWPPATDYAREKLPIWFPRASIDVRRLDTQTAESLPFEGVDFVHVDGDHSFDGCYHDLCLAAGLQPKWILVDDMNHHAAEVGEAAKRFVRETGFPALSIPSLRGDLLIQC